MLLKLSKTFIVLEFTAGDNLDDPTIGNWAATWKELKSSRVFVLGDECLWDVDWDIALDGSGCLWGIGIEYWDTVLDVRTGDGDWDNPNELETSSDSLSLLWTKNKTWRCNY